MQVTRRISMNFKQALYVIWLHVASCSSSSRTQKCFKTLCKTQKLHWSFYWRGDKLIQVEFWTAFMSLCRDVSLGKKVQMEREKAAGKIEKVDLHRHASEC